MQSNEQTSLNWVADFKDRGAEADALGMQGHRVDHALEPLLIALAAERTIADRGRAVIAEMSAAPDYPLAAMRKDEVVSELDKGHRHTATLERDGLWHCASCPASWPRFVYASCQK